MGFERERTRLLTKYFNNEEDNAAFECYIDFIVRMIEKYGDEICPAKEQRDNINSFSGENIKSVPAGLFIRLTKFIAA